MLVGDYLARAAMTGKHDVNGDMGAKAFLSKKPHETLLKGVDSEDVNKIYGHLTGGSGEIFEATPKLQRHMNRQRERFKNVLTRNKRLKGMDEHGYLDLDDMMTARTLGRETHLPPEPAPIPVTVPTPEPTPIPAMASTIVFGKKPTPMSARKKWGIGLGIGGGMGGAAYGLYRYRNGEQDDPPKKQKKWYDIWYNS